MKFLQELLTRNNASLRTEKTTGGGKYTHFPSTFIALG